MNTPPEMPSSQPAEPTTSPQTPKAGLLHALLRRAEEVYFCGGLALVLIGAGPVANQPNSTGPGAAFAGLGLCVAGGLCFVASAIVHRGGNSKQQ
jgi:hypothetical protein